MYRSRSCTWITCDVYIQSATHRTDIKLTHSFWAFPPVMMMLCCWPTTQKTSRSSYPQSLHVLEENDPCINHPSTHHCIPDSTTPPVRQWLWTANCHQRSTASEPMANRWHISVACRRRPTVGLPTSAHHRLATVGWPLLCRQCQPYIEKYKKWKYLFFDFHKGHLFSGYCITI